MKLEMDCIGPLGSVSISKIIGDWGWRKIHYRVCIDANFKCESCGNLIKQNGSLTAHETWNFDDVKYIQTLTGIKLVCRQCHLIHHGYLTQNLIETDNLTRAQLYRANEMNDKLKQLRNHFMAVNDIGRNIMEREIERIDKLKKERHRYEWAINTDKIKELIKREANSSEYCDAITKVIGFNAERFTEFRRCSKCSVFKGINRAEYLTSLLMATRNSITENQMCENYLCRDCTSKVNQMQVLTEMNSF